LINEQTHADLVRELSRVATQVEEMHRLLKAEHDHHAQLTDANAASLDAHEKRISKLERLAAYGTGVIAGLGVLVSSIGAAILVRLGLL
jgi:hypothetical protein